MKSVKLEKMPRNIVILDYHDFAGVMTKVAKALSRRFNVTHIKTGNKKATKQATNCFKQDPKDTLILLSEPGTLVYEPKKDFLEYFYRKIGGVKRPKNIPFGIWWSGSVYRVDNHVTYNGLPKYKSKWFKRRRDYFNSLTPFKLVGTDCLIPIDRSAYYVGQPMPFPEKPPTKNLSMERIIHVASSPLVTDYYKGTNKIRKSFDSIVKFMRALVIVNKPHNIVMERLRNSTMYAMTMTDWPSGIGYTGIEAMTNGCLVFSKNSGYIDTPIVNVENPKHLTKMVWYYHDNRSEREKLAMKQFEWGKANFSNKAFCKKFEASLKDCIEGGWE